MKWFKKGPSRILISFSVFMMLNSLYYWAMRNTAGVLRNIDKAVCIGTDIFCGLIFIWAVVTWIRKGRLWSLLSFRGTWDFVKRMHNPISSLMPCRRCAIGIHWNICANPVGAYTGILLSWDNNVFNENTLSAMIAGFIYLTVVELIQCKDAPFAITMIEDTLKSRLFSQSICRNK